MNTEFAWQGFAFSHPEDWAPINVSGNRAEGYARLASSGKESIQIRWKKAKDGLRLDTKLESYLARLGQDAKKERIAFQSKVDEQDGRLQYKWLGAGQGRGALFYSEPTSRVFFLEIDGDRKGSLLPAFRQLIESFDGERGERELWAVLGLRVAMPYGLELERHEFKAGKTTLWFKARGASIECSRWGFAEQLLEKYELAEWATAALRLKQPSVRADECGTHLTMKGLLESVGAFVSVQPDLNQIVTIRSRFRHTRWRPQCDWVG